MLLSLARSFFRELRQAEPFQHGLRNPGTADAGAPGRRLTHGGGRVPVEGLPQETPGTVEPCLDCLRAKGQVGGGLLDAHLLDVSEDKDDAEGLGQFVHGAFEQTPRTSAWVAAASGSLSGRADGR